MNGEQRGIINGVKSDWELVSSDISQGSVFDPLLFVAHIYYLIMDVNSRLFISSKDMMLRWVIPLDKRSRSTGGTK